MSKNFHRWEVDPFFCAAEEVQDSADRLESVYRAWISAKKTSDVDEIHYRRRELGTALGTTKWQLEEFERAISNLVNGDDWDDDTPARHRQFIDAICSQIAFIEGALLSSECCMTSRKLSHVNLCQDERDDFAHFLCGSQEKYDSNFPQGSAKNPNCPSFSKNKRRDLVADGFVLPSRLQQSGKTHVCGWEEDHVDQYAREGRLEDASIDVECIDMATSDLAPEHLFMDDSDGAAKSAEQASKHIQSASLGGGLYTWRSGSVSRNFKLQQGQVGMYKICWGFLRGKGWNLERRLSKAVLKRWKDGDAFLSSYETVALLEGGKFQKLTDYKICGGHLLALYNAHNAFPANRPVQIVSAFLVAFMFVGLLSFHVTAASS